MKTILYTFLICILSVQISNAQWIQMTNGIGDISIQALAVKENNIFAASAFNGLYRSTDNGATWTQHSVGGQALYSLAVKGDTIFAGTNSAGLWRSTNNGTDWTQIPFPVSNIFALLVNENNIFAGTHDGVYKSTNIGTNWTPTSLTSLYVRSFAVNGNNIFAGTDGSGVYLSTDNGTSWNVTGLGVRKIISLATIGNNIFAGTDASPSYFGIYISTDNGTTWTQSSLNDVAVYALLVSGNNIIAGTTHGQGIYVSSNYGTSWIKRGAGLASNNVYSLCILNNYIFAGLQAVGVWRRPLDELITTFSLCYITAIPEGFYNIVTNELKREDTLRAYLRNAAAPYDIVDSAKTVIDSVSLVGSFTFIPLPSGNYYIVLKHRNSLETWSKSGGETYSQGDFIYDFTNAASKAYGSNMIQVDSSPLRFAIYSGDVNQDGIIEGTDASIGDNDAFNFIEGYVASDVNGDYIVDGSDLAIIDNNASNFVSVARP